MTEKQPSAEAMEFAKEMTAAWGYISIETRMALALDAFAERSWREAMWADVCRSLGQYSGRNVQPAIEQSGIEMTEEEKAILRKYLPGDLPAERLEAMARAMYEHGPMFKNTGLAWDTFPDYLADRRAVYIADALTAYRADPIMRELYPGDK